MVGVEGRADFRPRGLQETHGGAVALGAGEANEVGEHPEITTCYEGLGPGVSQKLPLPHLCWLQERVTQAVGCLDGDPPFSWLSMETQHPWWSWSAQRGSTLGREEPAPKQPSHPRGGSCPKWGGAHPAKQHWTKYSVEV